MKLQSITLRHFRGFDTTEIPLHPQITLLVGINGAGKSSILEACAILLSWITARIRQEKGVGRQPRELDIQNGKSFTLLRAVADNGHAWQLVKTRQGNARASESSDLAYVSSYARSIQAEPSSLPLFVYYPVNRAVLDIPLRIRKKHEFERMEAYEQSLTGSGANFRSFFEWYRNREDLENERLRDARSATDQKQAENDPQLEAVRTAIHAFMPGFSHLSVRRSPLRMTIRKGEQELSIDQLSDGEKCTLALVGDLARRLAIANPGLDQALEGTAIVLLDEIELHLHPGWQRSFISRVCKVFPNCQWIISTHSPQTIGEVAGASVRILSRDENSLLRCDIPDQALGMDASLILEEVMDTQSRNAETEKELHDIFQLIDNEDFVTVKTRIDVLKRKLNGSIPDLVRAETMITLLQE